MKKIDIPTYTVEEILTALEPHYVSIVNKSYPAYMVSKTVILMLPQLLVAQRSKTKKIDEINKIASIQEAFTEIYHILDDANINSILLTTNSLNVSIKVEVVRTDLFLDPQITAVVENDKQESVGLRFTINGINYIPISRISLTKAKQILEVVKEHTK